MGSCSSELTFQKNLWDGRVAVMYTEDLMFFWWLFIASFAFSYLAFFKYYFFFHKCDWDNFTTEFILDLYEHAAVAIVFFSWCIFRSYITDENIFTLRDVMNLEKHNFGRQVENRTTFTIQKILKKINFENSYLINMRLQNTMHNIFFFR